jgi:hypothetical protein
MTEMEFSGREYLFVHLSFYGSINPPKARPLQQNLNKFLIKSLNLFVSLPIKFRVTGKDVVIWKFFDDCGVTYPDKKINITSGFGRRNGIKRGLVKGLIAC